MRKIAAMAGTVALMLCAGAPGTSQAAGSLGIAERSGFLLGAAHYCGVPADRVVQVGQQMITVIAGGEDGSHAAEAASKRFAQFFVAASRSQEDNITVRCGAVSTEFLRLERHTRGLAPTHTRTPSPARG
jgi:hypothetical protein